MWQMMLGLVILGGLIYMVLWMRKQKKLPYLTDEEIKQQRVDRMKDVERTGIRDRRVK